MPPKNDNMVKPTKSVSKSTTKSRSNNSGGKKNGDPDSLIYELAQETYQDGGVLTYDSVLKFGDE
jgi:hypothetical protein